MLKMFRDRENGLCGGACRDSAQISRHLEKADTETLVDELMELTERAANGDVNLEQIDAYLDALDEKDPLPFKADSKAALSDFHNRHGLLIKESRAAHQRHLKTMQKASRIAAAIAVVCVMSSLVAEACGIDLLGTIARWTSEVFVFEQNDIPYVEVERYPIEIGETKEYDTLQDAVEALGIAAPLVPSWVPERYILLSVSVDHRAAGAAIYADYKSEDGRLNFRFSESARANQQIIEKDGTMEQIVLVKNIRHHILADQTETKISWINGDFECRASGDISEQEAKEIINSIYKED